jgi:lambda family phage portal protein
MVPQAFGGGTTPLALEVLEADQLDHEVDGQGGRVTSQVKGGTWRMGVHVDDWGRPIEYAFLVGHPGDRYPVTAGRKHALIPAREVIHLMITERPGQSRGVSWFASAIKNLHQLSGFAEAEVVRARAASSLMGFITTDGDAAGEAFGEEGPDGEYVTQFEPGVIKTLFPGQGIQVPDLGSPNGQFEPFVRAMLRAMASGLGVSYESLSSDFSQTNYSSSRLSLLSERENWRSLQQYLIREFHAPIFRAWMMAAVAVGDLSLPGYEAAPERYEDAVRWVPRGWEWVDPTKEGQAYREAVRDGFMTQAEVVMSRGGDYQELLASRSEELAQADDLGLIFDTDPRHDTPSAPIASSGDGSGSMSPDQQGSDGSSA